MGLARYDWAKLGENYICPNRYLTFLANRCNLGLFGRILKNAPNGNTDGGYAPTERLIRDNLHPGGMCYVQGFGLKAHAGCPSAVFSTPGAAKARVTDGEKDAKRCAV